jgi:hypothetical protein
MAILALLVQMLAPAAAMAAQSAGGVQTICVASGVTEAAVKGGKPAPHKGFAGLPCQNCLAVAHALIPAPTLDATPVVHAVVHVVRPPAARFDRQPARAPPRPPGQGPPAQIA